MHAMKILKPCIALIFCLGRVIAQQSADTVVFPAVEGPLQISREGHEHLLASYYGINSFDPSERYVTVLETDVKFRLPDENDTATLGLIDLQTHEFIPLTQTRAWNFQQGCMAHWLGRSDSLIIFNDFRNGAFIAIIFNVFSRKEVRVIPRPVSGVSPDGREALSLNFSRLRMMRPDYGYGGSGQAIHARDTFPRDDGLFLIHLETGKDTLLVPLAQIRDKIPPLQGGSIAWFNHTLFSRDGTQLFWLCRQRDANGWVTYAFTANRDGTGLKRCFPDGWGGSHYDWLSGTELMVTAKWQGKQFSHILFSPGSENYMRLGNGTLDFDAHGTFSPNRKWMITDTYPDAVSREQKIFLMDMQSQAVRCIGRFTEPVEFSGYWRCDLHCRWSPQSDQVAFNSTRSGSRQVYLLKLKY
jgi:hypothetical protein